MSENTSLPVRTIGEQVIARIDEKCAAGLTFPPGYSYNNAITAAMLAIQDLRDCNRQPALSVCTTASIQQALFKMAIYGQNVIDGQGYFIVHGNALTYRESYFGKVMRVRRIYPSWQPVPRIIYKSDVFEYATDPDTGLMRIIRHEQRLENIDEAFDIETGFRGAYMYYPLPGGKQDLFIMTNAQIRRAWAKSEMKSLGTHRAFTSKMIAKTLINSCCSLIINTQPELGAQELAVADPYDIEADLDTPDPVDTAPIEVIDDAPLPAAPAASPVPDATDAAESPAPKKAPAISIKIKGASATPESNSATAAPTESPADPQDPSDTDYDF